MKKLFYTTCFFLISSMVFAQSYVERVLVLNEGYYDYVTGEILTPVSVGTYNPATNTYATLFDIDGARYASDILIDGDRYFVAADNQLLSYDLMSDELLASTEVEGIRKVAVWNEQVIVSRGEYLVDLENHVEVFNRNDLSFLYSISTDEIPFTTEGIMVVEDKAYIAVNNGFDFGNEAGLLAVLDMNTGILEDLIDLGPDGKNPDNIMFDGTYIYTLNNQDYSGSSVSSYKVSDGSLSTQNLMNISAGCGTSALLESDVYYQELFGTSISQYDPAAEVIVDEQEMGTTFYALLFDELNERMYTTVTDFFSYGNILVYDLEGNLLQETAVGVSPGNIALDIRTSAAISLQEEMTLDVYPNPAMEVLHFGMSINGQAVISNMTGSVVRTMDVNGQSISVSDLTPGFYSLQLTNGDAVYTSGFVHQ